MNANRRPWRIAGSNPTIASNDRFFPSSSGFRWQVSFPPTQVILLFLVTIVAILSIWYQRDLSSMYSPPQQQQDDMNSRYMMTLLEGGRRTRLKRDEFIHKWASEKEIADFFHFEVPSDKELGRVDPMWTCSDYRKNPRERQKKLIFVHMPRSAGATIRTLLRGYSHFCNAGMATVSHCVGLGLEYMEGSVVWRNGRASRWAGQNCYLSTTENRTGHSIVGENISTALLEKYEIDILAGHIPLGCDEFWIDGSNAHVDAQYVVFLREPLHKYVSQLLFEHREKNLSIDDALSLVNETVLNQTRLGNYYEKSSNYLITPDQKAWAERERVSWNAERRRNLTLSNIINKRVLIGLVERIPQSLEILQYVLDERQELPKLFEYFSSIEKLNNITKLLSKSQADAVVSKILQDQSMMSILDEYLKFETQLYSWGVKIHEKQLESMRQVGWHSFRATS